VLSILSPVGAAIAGPLAAAVGRLRPSRWPDCDPDVPVPRPKSTTSPPWYCDGGIVLPSPLLQKRTHDDPPTHPPSQSSLDRSLAELAIAGCGTTSNANNSKAGPRRRRRRRRPSTPIAPWSASATPSSARSWSTRRAVRCTCSKRTPARRHGHRAARS